MWYDHRLPLLTKAGWQPLISTWAFTLTITQFAIINQKEAMLNNCARLLLKSKDTTTEQLFGQIEEAIRMHDKTPIAQRIMELS